MSKAIVYKSGWGVVPPGIIGRLKPNSKSTPGLLAQFDAAEAKLYFVLADACKYSGEIRASNVELMEATGLDGRSLRRARNSLHHKFKIIEATPADGRRENYTYRVLKSAHKANPQPADVEIKAVPIPRTITMASLNPVPSLEGVQPESRIIAPIRDGHFCPPVTYKFVRH